MVISWWVQPYGLPEWSAPPSAPWFQPIARPRPYSSLVLPTLLRYNSSTASLCSIRPESSTRHGQTRVQRGVSALSPQSSALSLQHSALSTQPSAPSPQHGALSTEPYETLPRRANGEHARTARLHASRGTIIRSPPCFAVAGSERRNKRCRFCAHPTSAISPK